MRRWILLSRAERGGVILSGAWTTSIFYKPREIERWGLVEIGINVSPYVRMYVQSLSHIYARINQKGIDLRVEEFNRALPECYGLSVAGGEAPPLGGSRSAGPKDSGKL
jgi:hypothetical protein